MTRTPSSGGGAPSGIRGLTMSCSLELLPRCAPDYNRRRVAVRISRPGSVRRGAPESGSYRERPAVAAGDGSNACRPGSAPSAKSRMLRSATAYGIVPYLKTMTNSSGAGHALDVAQPLGALLGRAPDLRQGALAGELLGGRPAPPLRRLGVVLVAAGLPEVLRLVPLVVAVRAVLHLAEVAQQVRPRLVLGLGADRVDHDGGAAPEGGRAARGPRCSARPPRRSRPTACG